MKSLVYETPVNSAEELVARISAAAGEIRNTPEMLSNVRRSMKRRCEACITCDGRTIGHFSSTFSLPLYYRASVHPMVNVLSTYHLDGCTPNIKSLKLFQTNFPCGRTHFHCKYPTKVQSGWGRFPTVHTILSVQMRTLA
ncbi:hypothetical protein TNCV_1615771 [Trichonephila clavipes]|nr:hypothetical protein TNCV_1615771 [Trichonephila clavipes]